MDLNVYKVNHEPFCVKEVLKSLESVDVPLTMVLSPLFQTVRKEAIFVPCDSEFQLVTMHRL